MKSSKHCNTKRLFRNSHGCIGSFKEETGEFHKEIYGSRGFLQKPLALCFDYDYISEVEDRLKLLTVHDRDTDKLWVVTAEIFFQHRFLLDRGQGKQWALRLSYFTCNGNGDINSNLSPILTKAPITQQATQPVLFDLGVLA